MTTGGPGAGRVEAVFFDLYGTVADLVALDRACAVAAGGRGTELAARWRGRQLEATWLRNSMGRWADFREVTRDALGIAADELGVALDEREVERTLLPAWATLPARFGMEALLDRLDAAGLPAGILTNGSAEMLRETVAGAGLVGRFRWSLSVDAVRRYKPAPEVYELAVAAAGVGAEALGFVTANGWDAAGAAAFGFRVGWLRPPGAALPAVGALDRPPVAVTLDGVAPLFGA